MSVMCHQVECSQCGHACTLLQSFTVLGILVMKSIVILKQNRLPYSDHYHTHFTLSSTIHIFTNILHSNPKVFLKRLGFSPFFFSSESSLESLFNFFYSNVVFSSMYPNVLSSLHPLSNCKAISIF